MRIRLATQKRCALIPIFLCSLVLAVFTLGPLIKSVEHFIELYEPALNETTPILHITSGHIEFEGNIPQTISLSNGVKVFFDSTASESLFQDVPRFSLFFSQKEVWLKTKDDVKKLHVDEINVDGDSLTLAPLKVKARVSQFLHGAIILFSAIAFFLIFAAMVLLTLFAAGIGLMIDAFKNGPATFGEIYNWTGWFLFVPVLLWIILPQHTFAQAKLVLALYLVGCIIFVYVRTWLNRGAGSKYSGLP